MSSIELADAAIPPAQRRHAGTSSLDGVLARLPPGTRAPVSRGTRQHGAIQIAHPIWMVAVRRGTVEATSAESRLDPI
jgi:hypothetical protein